MHNDPIGHVDLWGLRIVEGVNPGSPDIFNSDELSIDEKIRFSIYKIAGTSFGKTDYGKSVVSALLELYSEGGITVEQLEDDTRAIEKYYVILGIKIKKTQVIIDIDEPYEAWAGRLAHEGTHLVDDINKLPYDLSSERRAYNNAAIVDKELNYPVNNPSDTTLKRLYPHLKDPGKPEKNTNTYTEHKND